MNFDHGIELFGSHGLSDLCKQGCEIFFNNVTTFIMIQLIENWLNFGFVCIEFLVDSCRYKLCVANFTILKNTTLLQNVINFFIFENLITGLYSTFDLFNIDGPRPIGVYLIKLFLKVFQS